MKHFICPGAQKAGTTTLHNLLIQHPEINLPYQKETKYFLDRKLILTENDYIKRCFTAKYDKRNLFGEIDPEYFIYPEVPQRINEVLGNDVKLIFMLRNPVNRAYSHYWMSFRRGFETESFEDSFLLENKRLQEGGDHAIWHQSYFERGLYAKQIKRYLEYYPINNIHFVLFEDFVKDIAVAMKEILAFLEVDPRFVFTDINRHHNVGGLPRSNFLSKLHGQPMLLKDILKRLIPSKKLRWWLYPIVEKMNRSKRKAPVLGKQTRTMLEEYFKDDITDLKTITSLDFGSWYTK